MNVRERIITYLRDHPEGVDDDELAAVLALKHRQHANSECRKLERNGVIERKKVQGKIRNFLKSNIEITGIFEKKRNIEKNASKPWFWEGNIQAEVSKYLEKRGYIIDRCADTEKKEKGPDIAAHKGNEGLWITVKGFPEDTGKTRATNQAAHWFKEAIFDLLVWRGRDKTIRIAVALPDFQRYQSLSEKIAWLQPFLNFTFIWVKDSGYVSTDGAI